jgi:methylated-DNA-protein-cysteine methyltransferase related protein
MPKSPFFIRIKSDVLKLVSAIPEGKVCSYSSIGEHLDVVPRHVAYILSTLEPLEKIHYPWHRVVGGDGKLGNLKLVDTGKTQSQLLNAEVFLVTGNSIESSFDKFFVPAEKLKSGVPKQVRPADAPTSRNKRKA